MSTAVVVVLFMNEEMNVVTGITHSSTLVRLPPATREITSPRWSMTPPFMSAPESTKMEARMMMMSFENPEKASSTLRIPERTRTQRRERVATSTATHSVANRTTTAARRKRTRKMEKVTRPYCAWFLPRVGLALDIRAAAPYSPPAMEILKHLLDFVLHLDKHLRPIIQEYGAWTYLILFAIVFCETGLVVTPFLPGDSLLFAAGAFAANGSLSIWVLVGILIVAAVLGDTVNYWVGHFLGHRLLNSKRFRVIKPEHLAYTHEFYEKYGGKTIILARFVPIVRTFAPFVAGLGSMSYGRFMSYNVIGGVAWVLICTVAGYLFGNLPVVQENFSLVVLMIIVLSLLPAVWEIWRARQAGRRARPS